MMLTPISLWKDFSIETSAEVLNCETKIDGEIKYEYIEFSGRNTANGKVVIYGAIASSITSPSKNCVLILQDADKEIDETLLAYFVEKGYTAMCVDYSGEKGGEQMHTVFPTGLGYANWAECKFNYLNVPQTAKETCWFEWTVVGAYARQLLSERFATENIGLVGANIGGEIAWKLAYVGQFSCAITINSCGWQAYRCSAKYVPVERPLSESDYKFIAALDSQAYAPYVNCPILMLCSTGVSDFNYDRAYDTFSRINPKFAPQSSIAYSLNCDTCVDASSERDMFMFLDSNVKKRYVFMPKPVDVSITMDKDQNLLACVKCDRSGIVEKCGAFISEDSLDFATRNWSAAALINKDNPYECDYALNVYEKTGVVFVLAYASYSSGFTVWSKVAVKKLSGRFRNSRAKSKILYSNNFGPECFTPENCTENSVGGLFLIDSEALPHSINLCGLVGVYSKCGLKTKRIMCPQFKPDGESILKFDVCSDVDTSVTVKLATKCANEEFTVTSNIIGGVWQSVIFEPKTFKNKSGVSLTDFTECASITINAESKFALNNLMWL